MIFFIDFFLYFCKEKSIATSVYIQSSKAVFRCQSERKEEKEQVTEAVAILRPFNPP